MPARMLDLALVTTRNAEVEHPRLEIWPFHAESRGRTGGAKKFSPRAYEALICRGDYHAWSQGPLLSPRCGCCTITMTLTPQNRCRMKLISALILLSEVARCINRAAARCRKSHPS
jgi:hypothetical protein